MKVKIVIGAILILIGLFHIILPHKVSKTIRTTFKHSPFLKDDKQLTVRPNFIIIFGIIWILLGVFVFVK